MDDRLRMCHSDWPRGIREERGKGRGFGLVLSAIRPSVRGSMLHQISSVVLFVFRVHSRPKVSASRSLSPDDVVHTILKVCR